MYACTLQQVLAIVPSALGVVVAPNGRMVDGSACSAGSTSRFMNCLVSV